MPEYFAESLKIDRTDDIAQTWKDLQQRADCSYFMSWGWIGQWLESIAYELNPTLVKIWHGDQLVGMGIFVDRRLTRHRLIHSNAMLLNEYPFNGRNMVIEYNGLLADKDHEQAVYSEMLKHLIESFEKHDEFFFGGLREQDYTLLQQAHNNRTSHLKVIEQSRSWAVDLDCFDQGSGAFLNTLSKNRRAQIRRALSAYEESGPIEISEAGNTEEALLYFDGLKTLHTERWQQKGGGGSFASPLWEGFHRSLITSRFEKSEIQLLRIINADEVIGYLYNFIWRNTVYVLQTGFKISNDRRLMPGYVCHVFAIAHNKQKGMNIYDLMHGDSLYKKILCNQEQTLYWLVIQRTKFRFLMEDYARTLVRSIKSTIRSKN